MECVMKENITVTLLTILSVVGLLIMYILPGIVLEQNNAVACLGMAAGAYGLTHNSNSAVGCGVTLFILGGFFCAATAGIGTPIGATIATAGL